MTIVTTSRKPLPEIRALARDLAFSIGSRYLTRGKQGLVDVLSLDETVVLVTMQGRQPHLQVYRGGDPVVSIPIQSYTVVQRQDEIRRGLAVSDMPLYEELKDYIDVFCMQKQDREILFDGTQKRRYTLELAA
ncbi:MAG: hypothetical protein KO206_06760 [Methanomicrobiaceae archaeon]|uniref:Uncharacterized protein n=1 Tax=hydrocarbon metagenome TaxID=938273 RepID=A0A0W8FHY4_9ZZZZ|nr:hypothetical protein [Methanomicrobiaceae archaeon]MDD5418571.1 hypothetical protein [Methanomicrobiaceae archaeon]